MSVTKRYSVRCPVCRNGAVDVDIEIDGPPPLTASVADADPHDCECRDSDLVDAKAYDDALLDLAL